MKAPFESRAFRPATLVAGLSLAAVLAVVALGLEFFGAPSRNPQTDRWEVSLSGPTMGTEFHVTFLPPVDDPHPTDERLDVISDAVQAALVDVNAKMSTYDENSELSRLNRCAADTPFVLSSDLLTVLQTAQRIATESEGAFDITVGPLVNAYGFGPDKRSLTGPDDAALAALREKVGFHMLTLDAEAKTATKSRADLYCDLSAIAKGFGVDRIGQVLAANGITDYLVEIGGEVITAGLNAAGEPWRIAIERPESLHGGINLIVPLSGLAMATSGDYRNYYEVDGQRLSHTIDPATGRPITHNLASVSVIADDCMDADGYATAISVLGPEKGLTFAEEHGLAVYMLVRTAEGDFEALASDAFERLVPETMGL